ncbi:Vacuolar fusion protein mon1 [Coemansia javaensis]|uniref:Vacuolar fusion protein MON1 n=1 Tax=Coemansia javaensis TaxID=2761396 RepID=A0A9W8HI08_9FUNG|nr:Vacuolar fusion protein mon1 [Coemansia javaensis]
MDGDAPVAAVPVGGELSSAEWRAHGRHFLVLSSAGKPIYTRHGDEAQLSMLMSAVQAIVSSFSDMSDAVRSLSAGAQTIVFYTSGPLYLLGASDRGDPEELLRSELQLVHSQIVSILTRAQLTRIFEQRSNFDLRQLLGGTEGIIDHLVDRLDVDFGFALGSLDTLWMRYAQRERVGKVLLSRRPKSLLYAMVVSDMKLVTLLRPRKHSLHPADLHLLFNMAAAPAFAAGEHWTPVCFPRFNDQGFLHVYISYIAAGVALVLVSADRDSFFAMTQCRRLVCEDLAAADDLLQRLEDAAAQRALHPSELGVAGLLQLYYRHKTLVQHFGTRFDESVGDEQARRIVNTYKRLRLHMAKGGQKPLRIIYYRSAADTVLAWQSRSFELYAAVAPTMDVKSMIRLVNAVLEWVEKEEDHLFVINSPSY